jgi:hypothetical protein
MHEVKVRTREKNQRDVTWCASSKSGHQSRDQSRLNKASPQATKAEHSLKVPLFTNIGFTTSHEQQERTENEAVVLRHRAGR